MFVRIPNVPNVAHNLPIGSRLSPFWERRKPWGLGLTWELLNNVSATGLADELREIRAGAQTRLRFCMLPVRLQV